MRYVVKGLIMLILVSCAMAKTEYVNKRFDACPDKPNCVSSLADKSSDRYIEPIDAHDLILDKIVQYIEDHKNWSLVSRDEDYIHATETSSLFKFVDDVEFKVEAGKLHFRSASRKGYYDFGVNRKRIEKIKEYLK